MNHVFEILVHRAAGASWTDALMKAIPERRGATLRENEQGAQQEQEQDSDADETGGGGGRASGDEAIEKPGSSLTRGRAVPAVIDRRGDEM